jgi:hypothetical protein
MLITSFFILAIFSLLNMTLKQRSNHNPVKKLNYTLQEFSMDRSLLLSAVAGQNKQEQQHCSKH